MNPDSKWTRMQLFLITNLFQLKFIPAVSITNFHNIYNPIIFSIHTTFLLGLMMTYLFLTGFPNLLFTACAF